MGGVDLLQYNVARALVVWGEGNRTKLCSCAPDELEGVFEIDDSLEVGEYGLLALALA